MTGGSGQHSGATHVRSRTQLGLEEYEGNGTHRCVRRPGLGGTGKRTPDHEAEVRYCEVSARLATGEPSPRQGSPCGNEARPDARTLGKPQTGGQILPFSGALACPRDPRNQGGATTEVGRLLVQLQRKPRRKDGRPLWLGRIGVPRAVRSLEPREWLESHRSESFIECVWDTSVDDKLLWVQPGSSNRLGAGIHQAEVRSAQRGTRTSPRLQLVLGGSTPWH